MTRSFCGRCRFLERFLPQSHRRFAALHNGLGYSMLADAIFKRIAPEWWYEFPTRRVHRDGELVSADLLVRLDSLARRRGGRLLAVALATNGQIGSNTRLSPVVERARERGVAVLDLASEFLRLPPTELRKFFLPRGHYSPAMNRAIADRIAAFLRKAGTCSASTPGPSSGCTTPGRRLRSSSPLERGCPRVAIGEVDGPDNRRCGVRICGRWGADGRYFHV